MDKLQVELRDILIMRFQSRQREYVGYSMRTFSKDLGIGTGTLSDFMAGKRRLSSKLISKLIERLVLNPTEKGRIALIQKLNVAQGQFGRDIPAELEIRDENMAPLLQWQTRAILSLIRLPQFNREPGWIAERLGISVVAAENAIQDLMQYHYIAETADGRLIKTADNFKGTDGIPNSKVRESNIESLLIAQDAFEDMPNDQIDMYTTTFVLNESRMDEAKVIIRTGIQFIMKSLTELDPANANRVYQFGMQLVPLSDRVEFDASHNQSNEKLS
jgi:uncharacterized protein (TIGR02147 family)